MALDWATVYNEISAVLSGLTYAERDVGTLILNQLARYGGAYDIARAENPTMDSAQSQALAEYYTALSQWILDANEINSQALQALNYVEVNVGRTASTFSFVTAPREEALSSGKNFLGRVSAVAGDADAQGFFGLRDMLKSYSTYFSAFYETYPIQTPSSIATSTLVKIPALDTPITLPAEQITFVQLEEKLGLFMVEGNSFLQAINYVP